MPIIFQNVFWKHKRLKCIRLIRQTATLCNVNTVPSGSNSFTLLGFSKSRANYCLLQYSSVDILLEWCRKGKGIKSPVSSVHSGSLL